MENKPVYKKDSYLSPNVGMAVLCYLFCQFVLGLFIIYIVAFIYSKFSGISYDSIIEAITNIDKEIEPNIINASNVIQGYANLITYLISTFAVVFYLRDEVKKDLFELKNHKIFNLIYIPLCSILFVLITFLIDLGLSNFIPESQNQQSIVGIMTSGGAVPMILCTVLLAPVVEELIFRKCVFKYFKKFGMWVPYLVSILLFTLPHMLSTTSDIKVWLLQCIPYATAGGLLCLVYHKGKFNIWTCIAAHILNNIVAVILVYLSM